MATLNLDGIFTGINSLFAIFSGIIGGVETQADNIGQLFAVILILGLVLSLIGGIFVVIRKSVGGFAIGGRKF